MALLKFVAFLTPACPCSPLFAYKASVPLFQITDILEDPEWDAKEWPDVLHRLQTLRKREENPVSHS